jgi:hypothetical protein
VLTIPGWFGYPDTGPGNRLREIGPPLSPRIYLTAARRLAVTAPFQRTNPRSGTGTRTQLPHKPVIRSEQFTDDKPQPSRKHSGAIVATV